MSEDANVVGKKLFGGTLYVNKDEVRWDTRHSEYHFQVGGVYLPQRKAGAEQHTVVSIDSDTGVVQLRHTGSNRTSRCQVQNFCTSYAVPQRRKNREQERLAAAAAKRAEKIAAAQRLLAQASSQSAPEAPVSSSGQLDVQELGKGLTALIHDRMDELEEKLTACIHSRMEALQAELTEQMNSQHKADHRVLKESLERMVTSITAQGKETEVRLAEAIIKGLS
jgi:hypothetical protein